MRREIAVCETVLCKTFCSARRDAAEVRWDQYGKVLSASLFHFFPSPLQKVLDGNK